MGALLLGASGLFFLNGVLPAPWAAWCAVPLAEVPAAALGMGAHLNPLTGSFLPALLPMLLLLGFKRARGALAGLAVGVAGYLLATAVLGEVNVRWIPGHGLLDFLWLAANGAVAAVLGRLAMLRD